MLIIIDQQDRGVFYCRLSVYKIAVLFMIDQQEFGYLLLSINKIVVMVTIDQQDRNVVSE